MTKDWRHQGACRNHDPELFFPVGNTGPALKQVEKAKAVCHGCPVMSQCRDWALSTRQDHGVWGGMSDTERRTVLRERSNAAKGTTPGSAPRPPCRYDEVAVARLMAGKRPPGVPVPEGECREVIRRLSARGLGYSAIAELLRVNPGKIGAYMDDMGLTRAPTKQGVA